MVRAWGRHSHDQEFGTFTFAEIFWSSLQAKEAQARQKVIVRWDVGLNKKHLASFTFARDDASELRLMTGALLVDLPEKSPLIWLIWCQGGQHLQLLDASCKLQAASFLRILDASCLSQMRWRIPA